MTDNSDDLVVPFVFVPHGGPEPVDLQAQPPGWFKVPATLTLRRADP